ncbi:tetratricopeptide repeat protein [Pelagibius sp.]|uniref:tetratricopeptide repeat protein n=1 Tax=Pelagibius sp. TaxID=1931238 RepID=UPI00260CD96F|nr:tetratricopeptide repeat protein [Pelagibius sp.]
MSDHLRSMGRRTIQDPLIALIGIVTIIVVGGLGLILISISASELSEAPGTFVRVLGSCILLATAVHLAGGLLGFLFGIPRSVQYPEESEVRDRQNDSIESEQAIRSVRIKGGVNTNLEQISDWLTKILVGVGLTQIRELIDLFGNLSTYGASSFRDLEGSQTISASIIALFGITGFLAGYLLTRLYLQGALIRADTVVFGADEAHGIDVIYDLRLDDQFPGQSIVPESLSREARAVRNLPFSTLSTVPELIAWARAQVQAGNFSKARDAYDKALSVDSGNVELRQEYARMLIKAGDPDAAIIQLTIATRSESAKKQDNLGRSVSLELMNAYLYDSYPGGFERAIEAGEELRRDPEMGSNPTYWLIRCAAFGQKYSWYRDKGKSVDELKPTRDEAFEAVKKTLQLRPSWRKHLQMLWDPNHPRKVPGEDDLEGFFEDKDEEFSQLLGNDIK